VDRDLVERQADALAGLPDRAAVLHALAGRQIA
jgi:hypothetical protein